MGKHIHVLSNIDTEKRQADCRACGRTGIKRRTQDSWRCILGTREAEKPYAKYKKDLCERCGFIPEHFSQLDVDHQNSNHLDNEIKNLVTLCANCHRLITWQRHLMRYRQIAE